MRWWRSARAGARGGKVWRARRQPQENRKHPIVDVARRCWAQLLPAEPPRGGRLLCVRRPWLAASDRPRVPARGGWPKGSQPVKKLGAHGYTTTSPNACFFSSFHIHILFIILHGFARIFGRACPGLGPISTPFTRPPCQPRRTKPLSPSSTPPFSSNCAIWGHKMTLHYAIEVCWDYPACRVRRSGRGRAPRTRALARARFSSSRRAHCCPLVRLRRASDCTRARGMVRASFLRNSAP